MHVVIAVPFKTLTRNKILVPLFVISTAELFKVFVLCYRDLLDLPVLRTFRRHK